MSRMLWVKAMSDTEEDEQTMALVNFRLCLCQIALFSVMAVAVITGVLVIPQAAQRFNGLGFVIIMLLALSGIFVAYYKAKYLQYLFLSVPVFTFFATKFFNESLIVTYGENFAAFYIMQIAINYFLCSSKIGLIYSIFTLGLIFASWALSGFSPQLLSNNPVSYVFFLIFGTVCGYIASRRFETDILSGVKKRDTDEQTGLLNADGFIKELKKTLETEKQFYVVLFSFNEFNEQLDDDNIEYTNSDKFAKIVAGRFILMQRSFAHARLANGKFIFVSTAENALVLTAQLEEFEKDIDGRYSELLSLPGSSSVFLSSGIVFYPGQAENITQILSFVEISFEKSVTNKNDVKNVFFMREYLDDKKRISTIQKDLFTACLNGELQVFYQPKVSLVDKEVTGMEALARWTHPSVGFIPPNEFVEIAEKSGHILALGEYVLESAFYHIKQVHKVCGNTNVSISINISPMQLLEPNFTEKILNRAKNFGVDPAIVYLEITEGTMLRKESQAILKNLKEEGFNLSLDDFGTGYSSLNYLHKYSFDELKIDKSFTDGLMRGRNERKLFRFLILLAKELGMRTVTEGVEDEVQIRLLKSLGAEEIQGWYYSKALPSFECIEYIQNFRFTDDDNGEDSNNIALNSSYVITDIPNNKNG